MSNRTSHFRGEDEVCSTVQGKKLKVIMMINNME